MVEQCGECVGGREGVREGGFQLHAGLEREGVAG